MSSSVNATSSPSALGGALVSRRRSARKRPLESAELETVPVNGGHVVQPRASAVLDDDHLEALTRVVLRGEALEAGGQPRRAVPGRDHHRTGWLCVPDCLTHRLRAQHVGHVCQGPQATFRPVTRDAPVPARDTSESDRDRGGAMRHERAPLLPRPPSGDPDVEPEGAQLLRHRRRSATERRFHLCRRCGHRRGPSRAGIGASTGMRRSSPPPLASGARARSPTRSPGVPGIAERMASVVPEAKLILMVRDPVERLVSQYLNYRDLRRERRPLAEAVSGPNNAYVARSQYAANLRPYLERFPRRGSTSNARRSFSTHRRETLRRIFAFLEVDEGFWSPSMERLRNTSSPKGARVPARRASPAPRASSRRSTGWGRRRSGGSSDWWPGAGAAPSGPRSSRASPNALVKRARGRHRRARGADGAGICQRGGRPDRRGAPQPPPRPQPSARRRTDRSRRRSPPAPARPARRRPGAAAPHDRRHVVGGDRGAAGLLDHSSRLGSGGQRQDRPPGGQVLEQLEVEQLGALGRGEQQQRVRGALKGQSLIARAGCRRPRSGPARRQCASARPPPRSGDPRPPARARRRRRGRFGPARRGLGPAALGSRP